MSAFVRPVAKVVTVKADEVVAARRQWKRAIEEHGSHSYITTCLHLHYLSLVRQQAA